MSGTRIDFLLWNISFAIAGFVVVAINLTHPLIIFFGLILNLIIIYKRIVNCGFSGFWILLMFVPLLNVFFFILLFFWPSKKDNESLKSFRAESENIKNENIEVKNLFKKVNKDLSESNKIGYALAIILIFFAIMFFTFPDASDLAPWIMLIIGIILLFPRKDNT